MKLSERKLGNTLAKKIAAFDAHEHQLPGVRTKENFDAFIDQLIDSIRRVRYIAVMRARPIAANREYPTSNFFDPLKAAELHSQRGHFDEAFWLVFLATHCGKNRETGWRLTRDLYSGLQQNDAWTWAKVSADPFAFVKWVEDSYEILAGSDGVKRKFGNHRKYETLKPKLKKSPGAVVASYVDWVGPTKSHSDLISHAQARTDADPRSVFNYLYRSMNSVASFGRTGRFDYLTMLGKMGLAPIEADSAYMQGATGPKAGGALLFMGDRHARINLRELDELFMRFGEYLKVGPQAMQVMEDAICNWQKSPSKYLRFTG
jgi:Alpha-glutamyl/putrescinyl thymine pyrophosphorylase clade 3